MNTDEIYADLKKFKRVAKKEDCGFVIPGKIEHKSKYPVNEVIGPGGRKVAEMIDSKDEFLPYMELNERVVNC